MYHVDAPHVTWWMDGSCYICMIVYHVVWDSYHRNACLDSLWLRYYYVSSYDGYACSVGMLIKFHGIWCCEMDVWFRRYYHVDYVYYLMNFHALMFLVDFRCVLKTITEFYTHPSSLFCFGAAWCDTQTRRILSSRSDQKEYGISLSMMISVVLSYSRLLWDYSRCRVIFQTV